MESEQFCTDCPCERVQSRQLMRPRTPGISANQKGELIMITMMTFAPFFVVALAFSGLITVLMSGAIDVQ